MTTTTYTPRDEHERKLAREQRPILDDEGRERIDIATCGHCGRSWNDAAGSQWTPAPSGRCPFEYEHEYPDPEPEADTMRYETMDLSAENLGDLVADAVEGIKTLGTGSRLVGIVDDEQGIVAYALSVGDADRITRALNAQWERYLESGAQR